MADEELTFHVTTLDQYLWVTFSIINFVMTMSAEYKGS